MLQWWRGKERQFPIFARIARDILAISTSTVASESAFRAGRRVLDDKRSHRVPESIEICACKKDWDQADCRTQGLKKNDDQDDDDPFMLFNMETLVELSILRRLNSTTTTQQHQPNTDIR